MRHLRKYVAFTVGPGKLYADALVIAGIGHMGHMRCKNSVTKFANKLLCTSFSWDKLMHIARITYDKENITASFYDDQISIRTQDDTECTPCYGFFDDVSHFMMCCDQYLHLFSIFVNGICMYCSVDSEESSIEL